MGYIEDWLKTKGLGTLTTSCTARLNFMLVEWMYVKDFIYG